MPCQLVLYEKTDQLDKILSATMTSLRYVTFGVVEDRFPYADLINVLNFAAPSASDAMRIYQNDALKFFFLCYSELSNRERRPDNSIPYTACYLCNYALPNSCDCANSYLAIEDTLLVHPVHRYLLQKREAIKISPLQAFWSIFCE